MPYRVTAIWRRLYMPVGGVLVLAAILQLIFNDPGRTPVTNVVEMSLLLAWFIAMSWRWWRSSTLIAASDKVTIRTLFKTITLPWEQIVCFVAETRPIHTASAIRLRRRVLGIRRPGGNTFWLGEIYCRPSSSGQTWIDAAASRLNELRAIQPAALQVDSQDGGPVPLGPGSAPDVA